jgi:hypothetical protein
MDKDENGPYILHSDAEKSVKEKENKKARCNYDVPTDIIKLLGQNGLKIMTQLIQTFDDTGE